MPMVSKRLATVPGMILTSLFASTAIALDGAKLYRERACIACHGEEGRVPITTDYPKIAGQTRDYILNQMRDIKSGARSNAHSIAMTNVMHLISDEEMVLVAEWLAGLDY